MNNKVGDINCMQNKCKTKLSSEFIIKHLHNDERLINKYNKFKKRNELYGDPNVKFCPIPDCDSYVRRSNEKEKYVTCENGHNFCFICNKNWHGKKLCSEQIDKDFKKWKKDKIVKRCPKCRMWTEKNHGCNHMTCAECKHQWCWLCMRDYQPGHYDLGGGCFNLQFSESNMFNCCICLILYKLGVFVLQFLLMIFGFLPLSLIIYLTDQIDDIYGFDCFSMILYILVGVCYFVGYYVLSIGIGLIASIITIFYWPLQEKIILLWRDIIGL